MGRPAVKLLFTQEEWQDPVRRLGYKYMAHHIRMVSHAVLEGTTGQAVQEAFAFLHGSAMDILMRALDLDARPAEFRDLLESWLTHQQAAHNGHTSRPLSAITSATLSTPV